MANNNNLDSLFYFADTPNTFADNLEKASQESTKQKNANWHIFYNEEKKRHEVASNAAKVNASQTGSKNYRLTSKQFAQFMEEQQNIKLVQITTDEKIKELSFSPGLANPLLVNPYQAAPPRYQRPVGATDGAWILLSAWLVAPTTQVIGPHIAAHASTQNIVGSMAGNVSAGILLTLLCYVYYQHRMKQQFGTRYDNDPVLREAINQDVWHQTLKVSAGIFGWTAAYYIGTLALGVSPHGLAALFTLAAIVGIGEMLGVMIANIYNNWDHDDYVGSQGKCRLFWETCRLGLSAFVAGFSYQLVNTFVPLLPFLKQLGSFAEQHILKPLLTALITFMTITGIFTLYARLCEPPADKRYHTAEQLAKCGLFKQADTEAITAVQGCSCANTASNIP